MIYKNIHTFPFCFHTKFPHVKSHLVLLFAMN